MTDEMSNKQFCRVRSNAQAEAGLEHRKLREEIERLRERERELGAEVLKDFADWCNCESANASTGRHRRLRAARNMALRYAHDIEEQNND